MRPAGVWKTQQSNVGDPLPVADSTSVSGHALVDSSSALAEYQSWLGAGTPMGILGRRRAGGRVGRSTVTFLSPVRDGRPPCGVTAALDDRPYAATLKAGRSTAIPVTVTASATLPRRRHEVWPVSVNCPQCSPRSSPRSMVDSVDSGHHAPSCVTDGRLASSSEPWPTCRASPSEWPLSNNDSDTIGVRLHSAEDTPV